MKNKEIIEKIDKALEQIDKALDYKTFDRIEYGVAKGMEDLHQINRELKELEKEKIYKVEIEEILSRVVEIEAISEEKAEDKARQLYKQQEIILDSEDFEGNTTFRIL